MSDRDAIRENIQRRTPKGMKRPAPKPQAKKEPKEGRLVPTSFRLPEELRNALEVAAKRHQVNKRDLVEFLLRAGLTMIETERIKIPKYQAPGPERIELPDIPEDLSG
jgi:hypothetical protein